MKNKSTYEHRQSASRMEATMVSVSGICVVVAIIAFFGPGWLWGTLFLILASIAFALSRVFDLLGDLFATIDRTDEKPAPRIVEASK